MRVVAGGRAVAGTITLATWLDPDEGIEERVVSGGGWADTEACANDVAPIALLLLLGGLNTGATWTKLENVSSMHLQHGGLTLVDDEVGRETLRSEERSKCIDVPLLITVGVALSVGWASGDAPSIVVGYVGRKTANLSGASSLLVQVTEELSRGADVGRPAEPASVSGVKVHDDVGKVERLHGVDSGGLVDCFGIGALLHVQVRDKIGETVGLIDKSELDIGVGLDLSSDGVDVLLVERGTVVGDGELAVGSKSSAVTVGQVVDDKWESQLRASGVLLLHIRGQSGNRWHLGGDIAGGIQSDLSVRMNASVTYSQ